MSVGLSEAFFRGAFPIQSLALADVLLLPVDGPMVGGLLPDADEVVGAVRTEGAEVEERAGGDVLAVVQGYVVCLADVPRHFVVARAVDALQGFHILYQHGADGGSLRVDVREQEVVRVAVAEGKLHVGFPLPADEGGVHHVLHECLCLVATSYGVSDAAPLLVTALHTNGFGQAHRLHALTAVHVATVAEPIGHGFDGGQRCGAYFVAVAAVAYLQERLRGCLGDESVGDEHGELLDKYTNKSRY